MLFNYIDSFDFEAWTWAFFTIFVPMGYCIPARTFLGVPNNLNEPFTDVPWAFSTICDLFKRKAQKRSGNVNDQGRWKVWNVHSIQLPLHITFTLQKRKNHCIRVKFSTWLRWTLLSAPPFLTFPGTNFQKQHDHVPFVPNCYWPLLVLYRTVHSNGPVYVYWSWTDRNHKGSK